MAVSLRPVRPDDLPFLSGSRSQPGAALDLRQGYRIIRSSAEDHVLRLDL